MSRQLEVITSSWLPPQDLWLHDPSDKIETPLTPSGLVDIDRLVGLVKSTVDSTFIWPTDPESVNIHHFYGTRRSYPNILGPDELNPNYFRNISVNKGLLPIPFHNWLHKLTLPPPMPSEEVRVYRVEAWSAARRLFQSVKSARSCERNPYKAPLIRDSLVKKGLMEENEDLVDAEIMSEVLERFFNDAHRYRERMLRVPKEFRLVDPEQSVSDITYAVGKLVAKPYLTLVKAATN